MSRPRGTALRAIPALLPLLLPAAAFAAASGTAVDARAQPRPPVRTLYERQDHRMLPVGTKIYYGSSGARGRTTIVYPGRAVPPAVRSRTPDEVVVSPDDPRGADERQRSARPAVCCATRH